MGARYTTELTLRYADVDAALQATPLALLAAMQEAAILQAEHVGRGMDWLAARGEVWMIAQTRLRIARAPRWRSRLRVTTWPSDIGRLLSRREFLLADGAGPCARATTLWAYVDTGSRRVTRVPAELKAAYPIDRQRCLPGPLSRPSRPAAGAPLNTRRVGRGDLDSNEHVNNLRLLGWMLDALPLDLHPAARLLQLDVRYQREGRAGQRLAVSLEERAAEGERWFVHNLALADSGEPVATAETRWAPVSYPWG
jgi:acyl-ACP thioesterase